MIPYRAAWRKLPIMARRTHGPQPVPLSKRVKAILTGTMQGMVRAEYAMLAKAVPPSDDEVRTWLDDLLSKQDTYRDATLAILAHPVANGAPMDVTVSPKGRRGVSQAMERLLTSLNIRCRKDVFQTIAKGSATLTGRDRESWNRLLIWASSQTELTEIERAFFYGFIRLFRG